MLVVNICVAYRNPGPEDSEWPRYTKESPVYYIYDAVKVGVGKGPRAEACEFWNGLMPEIKAFVGEFLMKYNFLRNSLTGTINTV